MDVDEWSLSAVQIQSIDGSEYAHWIPGRDGYRLGMVKGAGNERGERGTQDPRSNSLLCVLVTELLGFSHSVTYAVIDFLRLGCKYRSKCGEGQHKRPQKPHFLEFHATFP